MACLSLLIPYMENDIVLSVVNCLVTAWVNVIAQTITSSQANSPSEAVWDTFPTKEMPLSRWEKK